MPKGRKKKQYHADGQLSEMPKPIILKSQLRTLDELYGFRGAPYSTLDASEYQRQLEAFLLADLQRECIKRGRFAKDSRTSMITALMAEFNKYVKTLELRNVKEIPPRTLSAKGKKVLAEGANRTR